MFTEVTRYQVNGSSWWRAIVVDPESETLGKIWAESAAELQIKAAADGVELPDQSKWREGDISELFASTSGIRKV